MTDEPEFLRRWSRRKQAARKRTVDGSPPDTDVPDANGEPEPSAKDADPADQAEPAPGDAEALDLPDVESLTAESDFTPFLKPGVPKELKNRALRKLWRINPVFGQLDGLNDYDGDFTDAASVVKDLKTLYKVGRGFLPDPKEEPAGAEPGDAPAEGPEEAVEADRRRGRPEFGARAAATDNDDIDDIDDIDSGNKMS